MNLVTRTIGRTQRVSAHARLMLALALTIGLFPNAARAVPTQIRVDQMVADFGIDFDFWVFSLQSTPPTHECRTHAGQVGAVSSNRYCFLDDGQGNAWVSDLRPSCQSPVSKIVTVEWGVGTPVLHYSERPTPLHNKLYDFEISYGKLTLDYSNQPATATLNFRGTYASPEDGTFQGEWNLAGTASWALIGAGCAFFADGGLMSGQLNLAGVGTIESTP